MLVAKPCAGPAHAADHFVDMQQDIVFAANLLHFLPVTFGRGDHATTGGDGFKAQATHGFRALGQDHLFNLFSRPFAIVLFGRALLFVAAIFHAMGHAHEIGREGAILGVTLVLAAAAHRADGRAVIIALAVENFVFLAAIALMRDLPDHLKGFLVGLRARVGEIHAAHAGHFVDQHFRENRPRDRACRACEIVQLDQLIAHGIGNAFAAVAHVYRPHAARHRIEMLFAVLVPYMDALTLDDNAGLAGFERLVLHKVVPHMGAVHVYNLVDVVFECSVHIGPRFSGNSNGAGNAAQIWVYHTLAAQK